MHLLRILPCLAIAALLAASLASPATAQTPSAAEYAPCRALLYGDTLVPRCLTDRPWAWRKVTNDPRPRAAVENPRVAWWRGSDIFLSIEGLELTQSGDITEIRRASGLAKSCGEYGRVICRIYGASSAPAGAVPTFTEAETVNRIECPQSGVAKVLEVKF